MASQDSKTLHWYFAAEDYGGIRFHSRILVLSLIFFIFVILINMLFLYAHWLCRRRSSAGAGQSYAARTQRPAEDHCRGLEAVTIDSFPIILYGSILDGTSDDFKDVVEEESECSICLGVFQREEKIKVLPRCRHAYHAECVDKWLRSQSSCPLCRATLRIDEPLDDSAIP